jgi:hypothetical protein
VSLYSPNALFTWGDLVVRVNGQDVPVVIISVREVATTLHVMVGTLEFEW